MEAEKKKKWMAVIVILVVLGTAFGLVYYYVLRREETPGYNDDYNLDTAPKVSLMAENLEIPWSMDFLPDGKKIFTERPGRIRIIDENGDLWDNSVDVTLNVAHVGEGGLLGIVLHPNYTSTQYIYIYFTYEEGGEYKDKVVRYQLSLEDQTAEMSNAYTIIEDIPGASYHDGGRIKFGPDEKLYITTGDAGNTSAAQDKNNLAGKILRFNADGSIPDDNPFGDSPVYSYGHRNPQGLAWDSEGRLWSTEHGSTSTDELNLIEAGKNYGWPVIRGDQTNENMETPVIHSGSSTTWAPSGLAFQNDTLYWGGLRGEGLYVVEDVSSYPTSPISVEKYFDGDYGRIRAAVNGPNGFIYLLTSNKDGRNPNPADNDDLIIRVNPTKL